MRDWPPITEPELLQRLALDDEQFTAFIWELLAAWPRREFDPVAFEHALGYPWERPAGSFVLAGEDVQLLRDLDPVRRESTIAAFTEDRHPIVSFNANASPARLSMKFGHFPREEDRELAWSEMTYRLAEDLTRAACDDLAAVMKRASETVWPRGQQLSSRWTPFPGASRP